MRCAFARRSLRARLRVGVNRLIIQSKHFFFGRTHGFGIFWHGAAIGHRAARYGCPLAGLRRLLDYFQIRKFVRVCEGNAQERGERNEACCVGQSGHP